jgi:anti-anti-sigma regulatory factor
MVCVTEACKGRVADADPTDCEAAGGADGAASPDGDRPDEPPAVSFGGNGTGIRLPKPRPSFRAIFGARSPPSFDMRASLQAENVALNARSTHNTDKLPVGVLLATSSRISHWNAACWTMIPAMRSNDPTILARREGTTYVLKVVPSVIDSDLATVLRSDIEQAMKRRPQELGTVALEVSAVTAMCSSGFEALLLLYRLCKDGSLPLSIRAPKPEYHQLLQRMGFTRLFTIESA